MPGAIQKLYYSLTIEFFVEIQFCILYKKMLIHLSSNASEAATEITSVVGKPFTLSERQQLKGIRSPSMEITQTSLSIHNILTLENKVHTCTIVLYTKGITINIKVLNQSYALLIPFYKLSLYKGKAEEYSFYKDHYFIKVFVGSTNTTAHTFIKKIMRQRELNSPTSIEDL